MLLYFLSSLAFARESLISAKILTGDVTHTYIAIYTYFNQAVCSIHCVFLSKIAEAARTASFTLLPFDVHVYIADLSSLTHYE